METRKVKYFSPFAMWYAFGNCKSPFVNISCHLQRENLLYFDAFPANLHWREDSKFFLPAESWLANLNFPRQRYARIVHVVCTDDSIAFAVPSKVGKYLLFSKLLGWADFAPSLLHFLLDMWKSRGELQYEKARNVRRKIWILKLLWETPVDVAWASLYP